jgi:osmoprotectant transport system substrate-binding protein
MRKYCCWLLLLLLALSVGRFSYACVGRNLQIGYKNYTEQAILAEMLAVLIRERTGTSVTLTPFRNTEEAYRSIEAGNIQVFIEYTGIGLRDVMGGVPSGDAKSVYENVKRAYEQTFNLIWLRPFGYQTNYKLYRKDIEAGIPLEAVPIVKKETLRKFPALARLINQLSGKIDDKTIGSLIARVDKNGESPENVAGKFLKKLGISFAFVPGMG